MNKYNSIYQTVYFQAVVDTTLVDINSKAVQAILVERVLVDVP